jgi:SAM-dependent methyltransferase
MVLQASGLGSGFRVLDLGTGLGHVARLVAELVGPNGSVVGIDQSSEVLAVASQRAADAGLRHVAFVEGNATSWRGAEPFDAVVERLLLFHVADPVAVVRHHLRNLRAGGLFVAIDFDIGSARSEPAVPLVADATRWVMQAFAMAGAWPRIGARLGMILTEAGLQNVRTFGIQDYLPPHDASAASLLGGVVRSLANAIVQRGIATSEEVGLASDERIAAELQRANAVLLPPTVAGAWGHH